MTDEEIVEAMARAMDQCDSPNAGIKDCARAALSIAKPLIASEAREVIALSEKALASAQGELLSTHLRYGDIACRRISEALKRPRLPFDEPKLAPVQEALPL